MTIEQRDPDIPDYINIDLFETALRFSLKSSNIRINDLRLSWGSKKGENYCSEIYRAQILYSQNGQSNKTISLIVKAMPFMEFRGPILEALDVYNKEVNMYMETIPKLSKLANDEYFCAKCHYTTTEPVKMIIFDDLKSLGYTTMDRNVGLDLEHCKLLVKKLAKFHAASTILYSTDPKELSRYSFGLFRNDNPGSDELLNSIFNEGLKTCIKVVEKWSGYDEIVMKMKRISYNFIPLIKRNINVILTDIKVLNHGDLWVNNFLFKYDCGKPIDVIFVDYQMSIVNSPGLDLNYFLCTSPTNHVRENHTDDILREYHRAFGHAICDFDIDRAKMIPTIGEMTKAVETKAFYGFAAAIGVLPIVLLDKEKSKDSSIEAFMDEKVAENMRMVSYTNPLYQDAMKLLLKRFNDRNVLDYNCEKI